MEYPALLSDSESSGDDDFVIALILRNMSAASDHSRRWRQGSRRGKKPNIERNRAQYDKLLMADYFNPVPTYDASHFRRRFRMRKSLFLQIAHDLAQHDPYFQQKPDVTGRNGFSSLQKVAACVRYLATGCSLDDLDDRY
ncbi:hypothetical protein H257_19301 [Aphanomyces astaci]|uniref:Uncharacterized protein n=1 Tax=Aphanomyces astaci TaxID=112090 RepID=W4F8G4_APHAT|nr:hypothetical protein H257_19301 [Aphanomyces astaci]ETV63770.1 hypothetical protein H257_19301 [Aphanomyces astaci]|eukprot:XP_009846749.1 hypothetical protein H257_19301 [Aphanomyces astaci]